MHDLRAAPRWSKTSVVVVLVVFGLILIVAVLAILTLQTAAERSRTQARADALKDAGKLLEDLDETVKKRLRSTLNFASKIASDEPAVDEGPPEGPLVEVPSELPVSAEVEEGRSAERAARDKRRDRAALHPTTRLRQFLSGTEHRPYVLALFRVGAADEPRWFRGGYRLADGSARIEAEAAAQVKDAARDDALTESIAFANRELQRHGSYKALESWFEITRRFGLVTQTDEGTRRVKARGLTYAVNMLRYTADALEGMHAKEIRIKRVREVLLLALENESLNARRTRLDASYLKDRLEDLAREMQAVLDHLPEEYSTILRWEVDAFRRTRTRARQIFEAGVLGPVVNQFRSWERAEPMLAWNDLGGAKESQLFGIRSVTGQVEELVIRLNVETVEQLVRKTMRQSEDKFERLGMHPYLARITQDPALPSGRKPVRTHSLATPRSTLPFRIDLDRVGDPVSVSEQLTDWLFAGVVLLAVAGLLVGGRVLVRLLTREVRLAQLKADFVSNLSHELKTPITSISLFTEMLEDGKITDPEDQAEAYSVLAQESTRLQGLVHRMIDVARGEARETPYDLVPGDLNRPVLEAVTRFRRIVTEPGLKLEIQLHPAPLPMLMDLSSMDDVVTNLLSNAWKYKRGDTAVIRVQTRRRGRQAVLTVSDDGIGIPKAERRKVFEMFYRAEQLLTQPVQGTGLGLALVRSVVSGHKGRVRLESGPGGVGTSFRLRFPLDPRLAVHLAAASRESPSDSEQTAAPHGMVVGAEFSEQSETEVTQGGQPSDPQLRSGAGNPGAQS